LQSKNILITGGAGFIGSHLVRRMVQGYPEHQIINLDLLTYAGNLENLTDVEKSSNYQFVKGDICDQDLIFNLFEKHEITDVIHLAAESHVDRSISDPASFIKTNVIGTANLLNACRKFWTSPENRFHHVSTDEVFGSLGEDGMFDESTPYDPKSPYSSSKASSDMIVRAYGHTYGLNYIITNCSNNYGPNQFPEKLIPLVINNIKNQKEIPVYGTGNNVRDWLWVGDHASALETCFFKGEKGQTYCIGGNNEWSNLELVKLLIKITDEELGRAEGDSEKLITFVKDRAGHDFRYAIDNSKISNKLNWTPEVTPENGIRKTVKWYLENSNWLENIVSGDYKSYYMKQYKR